MATIECTDCHCFLRLPPAIQPCIHIFESTELRARTSRQVVTNLASVSVKYFTQDTPRDYQRIEKNAIDTKNMEMVGTCNI